MAMTYSRRHNMEQLRQSFFRRRKKMNSEAIADMERGAHTIMEQSKANAPVDTHNLEEAHRIVERKIGEDTVALDIEVSGEGAGSDDPRSVDEYAYIMHEWGILYGSGNWGEKTRAKQAASSNEVGAKYLERALEEHKAAVINDIRRAMKRNW